MIKFAIVCFVVLGVLFIAPVIGLQSQMWARWWFAGSTLNAPGVVPIVAPPQGPLLGDSSDLMRVIQPWMGVGYLFGGCTLRGVDCSCFTQITAHDIGYSLPRTAQAQYNATARVSQPEFGDLVFFQATYSSPDRITHQPQAGDHQARLDPDRHEGRQ